MRQTFVVCSKSSMLQFDMKTAIQVFSVQHHIFSTGRNRYGNQCYVHSTHNHLNLIITFVFLFLLFTS
jgi:hypothetical protein